MCKWSTYVLYMYNVLCTTHTFEFCLRARLCLLKVIRSCCNVALRFSLQIHHNVLDEITMKYE